MSSGSGSSALGNTEHRARRAVRRRADAHHVAGRHAARLEVLAEEPARVEDAVAEGAEPVEPRAGLDGVKRLVEEEGEGALERLFGAHVGLRVVAEEADQVARARRRWLRPGGP